MRFFEVGFDLLYLVAVIMAGCWLVRGAKGNKLALMMGVAALVLGGGDALHLAPRIIMHLTNGTIDMTPFLGLGTLATSITMTVFYLLLFRIWWRVDNGGRSDRVVAVVTVLLAVVRIGLCCFPDNQWLLNSPNWLWGVFRNVPFVLMGALIAWLFFVDAKEFAPFRWMWLAIALSFVFYIPVVLLADLWPMAGMLMLPKTVCYLWMVSMFIRARKAIA